MAQQLKLYGMVAAIALFGAAVIFGIYEQSRTRARDCVLDRTGEQFIQQAGPDRGDFDKSGRRMILGENENYRCSPWRLAEG